MKFFLDTANLEEIRTVAAWGILDGVTTNPSLVSKESRPFKDLIAEISRIVPGPISVECVSTEAGAIIGEARELARIAANVVIKIPVGIEGLKATQSLARDGVKVNMTLVFSAGQALLAAKAGAAFVSSFIGRLDDLSQDGMELIEEIAAIYGNYDYATEIIVASIRHPRHVIEAALIGAHIATIPFAVMEKLVQHPLTDIGIAKFLKDWGKVKT
ncbi:MAG: fructose-6-phosphate aldolase [Candidatus Aminicenantes bacterium]|jgi:transaldolase|nr:fructose-6-phosphate aldolase [Candidatus Aminicenantes bacterium]